MRRAGSGLILVAIRPHLSMIFPALAERLGLPCINVSLELSRWLLDVPTPKQARKASQELATVFAASPGDVVCHRLGLLHLPDLQLDALRALEYQARSRVVIAEWIGEVDVGQLSYARPGHREFHRWERLALPVVHLETMSS